MNPKFRILLFSLAGIICGIVIGIDLADESYGWAVIAALVCLWFVIERVSSSPPDAWLLALTLAGYLVGNRGFAQIQPASRIPLLPAEIALGIGVPALLFRAAAKRISLFRRDFLNYSIAIWGVLGLIRLPLDVKLYGVVALRDFAMVYYVAFFFLGQAFGSRREPASLLRSTLTLSYLCLLPFAFDMAVAPDFLVDNLTFRGIPIIFHKSDLIAAYLGGGFFWLWSRMAGTGKLLWGLSALLCLLLIGILASPRAAMAGVFVITCLWLLVGRWRILAAQAVAIATASVIFVVVYLLLGKDIKTSPPYAVYEHAVSIFDPAGTGSYLNAASGNPGDNNRFRTVWWGDVIHETLDANPVFGLGFGADLASKFLADYDLLSDESFAARSPHSMIVTVFGRMGFAGLLAWLCVSAAMWRIIWLLIKRGTPDGMGLASIAGVIWTSASVGVVLEGPMGAVVFWTVLGLANALYSDARVQDSDERERPVAKTAEPVTLQATP
jgi:hypothetical protein